MEPTSPERTPCFAREDELARLHAYLERALAGDGCVCFVTGGPGAGKSALLEAFAFEAKKRLPQLVIAAGDCSPQAANEAPYLPFREILSDLTDADASKSGPDAADRPSARFLSAAKRMVAEHGPDLIDIFIPGGAILTRVGAQAAQQVQSRRRQQGQASATESGVEQIHLFEQYTNVLRSLSQRQPLLLFVDDLHWADTASLNLMFHLSKRLGAEAMLLVGAYRWEDARGAANDGPLSSAINEFKRYHGDVLVDLSAVGPERARELTDALIDAEPNRLDESFRRELFERTSGHPLFTVELLRHLKRTGLLRHDADGCWVLDGPLAWEGLPARVEGVIAQHAAGLGAADRDLLEAASVLGRSFLADAVAAMQDLPARDVIRLLSGALTRQHGLVRAEGIQRIGERRVASYQFRHSLFRDYFYGGLDAVERVMRHEAAARALEALYGDQASAHAAQLAWHCQAAELPREAMGYHVAAGHQAREDYAQEEARTHFRAALGLLDELAEPDTVRAEVVAALGVVEQLDGRYEQSIGHLREAIELTESDSDLPRRAELHRRLAGNYERQNQHADALRELRRASELLGPPEERHPAYWWNTWISVALDQVRLHYWLGEVDSMSPILSRLDDIVQRHGNDYQRFQFWTGQSMRGYRVDRFRPCAATFRATEHAESAARATGNLHDLASALFGRGFALLLNMRAAEAIPLLQESLATAGRAGDRHQTARCRAYLLLAFRVAGEVAEVETQLPVTLDAVRERGMREYVGLVEAVHAWLGLSSESADVSRDRALGALETWRRHAPRYPLQWTALFPALATAETGNDLELATTLAGRLLEPVQAALPSELQEALERVRSGSTAQALAEALRLARREGYL